MDSQFLKVYYRVVKAIFIDFILLNDLCQSIEKSCMPDCENHQIKNQLEYKFNGINAIFELGNVRNFHHQEQLEDLTYLIIETTRNLDLSLEQRAVSLYEAWQQKIPQLK